MALVWDEIFSVGVQEIDEQHKKFIQMLNALENALAVGEEDKLAMILFAELEAYAVYHFSTEELYMEQFAYEHTEEHRMQHQQLISKVAQLKSEQHAGRRTAMMDLEDYMQGWLTDHIMTSDKMFSQCFRNTD